MRDSTAKGHTRQYSQPRGCLPGSLGERFRPGWLPSLVVLLLLPLLLWLGAWQLSRADEKAALLARHEAQRALPPVALDALPDAAPGDRRVRLHGRFDDAHSVLLDNRMHAGQAGVDVLQPFHDQLSGRWVLIDRGWLPWPDRRQPVTFDTPPGPLTLDAWVYQPAGKPFRLADVDSQGWPRLVNTIEPETFWQSLGRDGYPYPLRLEPGPAALTLDWPTVTMSPERHVGYAAQWFALAAALLGLYVYLGIHHARETRHASASEPC